jgi:hypothetical protein
VAAAAASPSAGGGAWWEKIQAADDAAAYEPQGFRNMATPEAFGTSRLKAGPTGEGDGATTGNEDDNEDSNEDNEYHEGGHRGAATRSGADNGAAAHGAAPTHKHTNTSTINNAEMIDNAVLYEGASVGIDGTDPDALFAQLLEMGYGEEDAHDAAFRCSTIEAAVEAINNKTDPEFLRRLAAAYAAPPRAQPPPAHVSAAMARDAAAAAAIAAAEAAAVVQPAADAWVTVPARVKSHGGANAAAGEGGPFRMLPAEASAILIRLCAAKKARLRCVVKAVHL